jgi:hypothetical protein
LAARFSRLRYWRRAHAARAGALRCVRRRAYQPLRRRVECSLQPGTKVRAWKPCGVPTRAVTTRATFGFWGRRAQRMPRATPHVASMPWRTASRLLARAEQSTAPVSRPKAFSLGSLF